MPDKMTELKPCPFCGGKAERCYGLGEHWVKCSCCDASIRMNSFKENAIEDWNRRVNDGK